MHAIRARLLSWSVTLTDKVHRASTNGELGEVEATIDREVRHVLRELSVGPFIEGGDDAAEGETSQRAGGPDASF